MNIKVIILLALLFAFSSCKEDKPVLPSEGEISPVGTVDQVKLPFACDIISEKEMQDILAMDIALDVMDGNRNLTSETSTSCFYKWDDPKYDVSGVMIQVNKNPLPDEIPDYVNKYMNNKRWEGENNGEDIDEIFKYSDLEGLDFPAIYNRETYKYYFGIKNTYLCSVAFNYPASPEQLDAWFKVIAEKMIKEV